MRSQRAGYILAMPSLLIFLLTTAIPAAYVVRLSLFDTDYLTQRFVGLSNYVQTFRDPSWWRSVWVTAKFAIIVVPAEVLLPLFVALLVVNERQWMQTYVRTVFWLPAAASQVVLSSVWRWILDNDGPVAWALAQVGMKVNWWADANLAVLAMSAMLISVGMGGNLVIFLAAILGIDRELYAAAQIDGASWGQIRRLIIAPMVSHTVWLIALIAVVAAAQIWYLPYVMTSGGPAHGTETIMFNIYLTGFWLAKYGKANARSLLLMALMFALAMAQRRMAR